MPSSNSSKNRVVRLVWPAGAPKDINDLYLLHRDNFKAVFKRMVEESIAQAKPAPLLKPLASFLDEVLAFIQRMARSVLTGISTGYAELDRITSGLTGIVLLGGPPKIGKSMFVLSIAVNAAMLGHPVILFDFENGIRKVALRLLSRLSEIGIRDMLLRSQSLTDSPKFNDILAQFAAIGQNLFVRRPSLADVAIEGRVDPDSLHRLFENCVRCIREDVGNDRPLLIVIDSLQKLPLWSMSDRRGNIDTWLRAFERARDELHITFLIVSELSRGTYQTPTLDSFKESGDVEYSADLALLLTMAGASNNAQLELHAVAHRDGESGLIATYRPDYVHCRFLEVPNHGAIIRDMFGR